MDCSEFLQFLKMRRSIREYSGEEITDGEVAYILNCAGTAPSAGNLEAWDVVVVTDNETKNDLSTAVFDQPHVGRAAVVLVVCANYIRSMSRYGERGILYAVQDATIACTYMMLAAEAEQLSSCWVGAMDEGDVREILGLPAHIRPIALLCLGKGYKNRTFTDRIAIDEHIHQECW
jgi:nitroreductase